MKSVIGLSLLHVVCALTSAPAKAPVALSQITPVEKVITLLRVLQMEVMGDGVAEATTYGAFATFCKTTTMTKSKAITDGGDSIDTLSSNIALDTAEKVEKSEELKERTKKDEELKAELKDVTDRCLKEHEAFEATHTDLVIAVGQLGKAITAMETTKTDVSLLEVRKSIASTLALAGALGLMDKPKTQSLQSFIQEGVDPADPAYKFRSSSIITLLKKLEGEFVEKRDDTKTEWDAATKVCDALKLAIKNQITPNDLAMIQLTADIAAATGRIATDRQSLVDADEALKDDHQYMQDLTERCEAAARSWDQRTVARNDEVNTLRSTIDLLNRGNGEFRAVKSLDEVAVDRALLLQKLKAQKAALAAPKSKAKASASFLQLRSVDKASRRVQAVQLHSVSGSNQRVADLLKSEGARLQSALLTGLGEKVGTDPFVKVKALLQQLIERLLKEATQEATKKGFCDTELGKAEKDREYKFADIQKKAAEHQFLVAEEDRLEEEIIELTDSIADLKDTLKNATDLRATEKVENAKLIKDASEGILAVTEGIKILKTFYKEAAKGKVGFLQASPVDEDTDYQNPGAYRGKQQMGGDCIGFLEVIKSDFDRTVRFTTRDEKEALAEFVKLDRTMKVDIETKETNLEQDKEDLKEVKDKILQIITDITTAQKLLDDALKTIEGLKPMCIDTSMTYQERVKKREDEITALKKAMCFLDADKVDTAVHGGAC